MQACSAKAGRASYGAVPVPVEPERRRIIFRLPRFSSRRMSPFGSKLRRRAENSDPGLLLNGGPVVLRSFPAAAPRVFYFTI
jgi:hypothetical protein